MTDYQDNQSGSPSAPEVYIDPKQTAEFVSGAAAELFYRTGERRADLASCIQQFSDAAGRQLPANVANSSQLVKQMQNADLASRVTSTATGFVTSGKQQEVLQKIGEASDLSKFGKGTVEALSRVTPKTVSNAAIVSNDAVIKTAASGATAVAGALGMSGASATAVVAAATAAAPIVAVGAVAAGGYALYKWLSD